MNVCTPRLEHHQANEKKDFSTSVLGFSHLCEKLASPKQTCLLLAKEHENLSCPLIILVIKR